MSTFLDFASLPNAKQVAKMERCTSAEQDKLSGFICKSSTFHWMHTETNRNIYCFILCRFCLNIEAEMSAKIRESDNMQIHWWPR